MPLYIETTIYHACAGAWTHGIGVRALVRDLSSGTRAELTAPAVYRGDADAYRAARVMRRYFKAHQRFPDVRLTWPEWGRLAGVPRRRDHAARMRAGVVSQAA